MSLDTAISRVTLSALPGAARSTTTGPEGPNAEVIAAIRGHHEQLADRLRVLTAAVMVAVPAGAYTAERDELLGWYRSELLPHAEAEEAALYGPAESLDATRLLVSGMLAEHRALAALIGELAEATEAMQVASAAAAARAVFAVHLSKENDLLLPALDIAGMDLTAALEGMHEILGHPSSPQDEHGCGCGEHGCGDAAAVTDGPRPVELVTNLTIGRAELDVRALPHGTRHEIIFSKLDQLQPGESLVIVNDHDPKPLRYQTEAMWPDRFTWSYLQSGPELWRVAITFAD
jgi:uncharacterized protein (DUF2249 family)